MKKFPDGFLWGAATSAHQVEGNNVHNDWWRAEQSGEVPHKSGIACDSYNRYEEDFDLAREMHNNAHRLSIEWSRIEPREGEFDESEMGHYRSIIRALRDRGLEPFVTLHHFTNPVWFADMGGWANKKSVQHFARYVGRVSDAFGDSVRYWTTFNEPNIYVNMSALGYGPWTHWPDMGNRNVFKLFRQVKHIAEAHRRAYGIIKSANPESVAGITTGYTVTDSYNANPLNFFVRTLVDWEKNKLLLNRMKKYQDYIGLNYYTRSMVRVRFANPEAWAYLDGKNGTDMGFEIYPEGIYRTVMEFAKYKKPIFILENGIADADDDKRPQFIHDHLLWLHRAIKGGADVRGYFHWSLLDNFEWAEGFEQKFGLVEVDHKTQKRTVRPSAYEYAKIIKNNGI